MKRLRSFAVPRRKLPPRSRRTTPPLRTIALRALVAFAALLAGTIVPVATTASDALPSDAVVVYECRFLEEWDLNYDRWPDRWTRRSGSEFPHYVNIRIQEDSTSADGRCLRIDLDGASAEVSSPPIPISPQFSYLFEARTKAQDLLHGEARVTIDFCDEADAVIQSVSSEPLIDGPEWNQVRLSVEPNDPRIRRAYIRLSVLRGDKPDLAARVSLGDITLSRFPRITVSTNHPFNVYQEAEPIVIHCVLSGILQQQPEVHFQLHDASQRILDEARLSMRGDLIAEAASTDNRQGARDAPSGYEGTCEWRPRIREPGLYCVTVNMLAPSNGSGAPAEVRQLDHRAIWIAIVPPLDIPMEGDFGWTLGEREGGSNLSDLARLLPQAAVNWVKLPLWFDAGDVNRGNELIRFVELLGASNIEVVGIIDRPPANVRIEGVAPRPDGYPAVADLFGLDSGVWSPSLDPVMIRLALRVRWWQLGRDHDTSFMGIADLNQQIAALRARLFRFGQEVKLGLAWDWLNDNQGAGKVTWDFQQFSSETPPDESQFMANLEKPRANDALRWILVEPPPRQKKMSAADHDLRTTEFVRRLVAAKQFGADGLFIPSPFDDHRGIMNDDGSPGPLFLSWRTTSAMLGGSRYLGTITLPEGSDNRIFLRPDGEVVMVVWSVEPKTETLYLGAAIRQFDLRGVRIASFDSTAEQSIAVGPMPTFVLGLHEQIARWRMSMRFKSVEIPSIFSVPHANAIQFENFFPQGVGGSFSIFVPPPADEVKYGFSGFVPDRWLIEPPRGTFRLAAGEKADIPFEIRLKNAMYGKQPIRIDFTIEADQPYRFSIYREMEVGTRDLTLEIRSHLDKDGVLIIEQLMSNTAERLADFKCNLYAKGQRRQRMQVFRLGPNIDRKIYRYPAGAKLVGEDMLLEIEELSGPRVIKYRFTATDDPPPAEDDGDDNKDEQPASEGVEETLALESRPRRGAAWAKQDPPAE